MNDLVQSCVSLADGVGDGVEGEHPRRRPEGTAAQHGLQPERPLPAALLRHPEGAGVKGETGLGWRRKHSSG